MPSNVSRKVILASSIVSLSDCSYLTVTIQQLGGKSRDDLEGEHRNTRGRLPYQLASTGRASQPRDSQAWTRSLNEQRQNSLGYPGSFLLVDYLHTLMRECVQRGICLIEQRMSEVMPGQLQLPRILIASFPIRVLSCRYMPTHSPMHRNVPPNVPLNYTNAEAARARTRSAGGGVEPSG